MALRVPGPPGLPAVHGAAVERPGHVHGGPAADSPEVPPPLPSCPVAPKPAPAPIPLPARRRPVPRSAFRPNGLRPLLPASRASPDRSRWSHLALEACPCPATQAAPLSTNGAMGIMRAPVRPSPLGIAPDTCFAMRSPMKRRHRQSCLESLSDAVKTRFNPRDRSARPGPVFRPGQLPLCRVDLAPHRCFRGRGNAGCDAGLRQEQEGR